VQGESGEFPRTTNNRVLHPSYPHPAIYRRNRSRFFTLNFRTASQILTARATASLSLMSGRTSAIV